MCYIERGRRGRKANIVFSSRRPFIAQKGLAATNNNKPRVPVLSNKCPDEAPVEDSIGSMNRKMETFKAIKQVLRYLNVAHHTKVWHWAFWFLIKLCYCCNVLFIRVRDASTDCSLWQLGHKK